MKKKIKNTQIEFVSWDEIATALENGKKINHRSWLPKEYIYKPKDQNLILTEEGEEVEIIDMIRIIGESHAIEYQSL